MRFERDEVERRIIECDEALASSGTGTDTQSRVRAAKAVAAKAYWLMESGRAAEAIQLSDELRVLFSDDLDLHSGQQIGTAVLKGGDALVHVSADPSRLVRHLRALRAEQLVEGLGHLWANPGCLSAATSRARDRLTQRRQALHQGISLFDLVIARFGRADDSASRAIAMEAKIHRYATLLLLGRVRAASSSWDELWASRASEMPALDEMVRREEQRAAPSPIMAPLLLLRAIFLRSIGRENAGSTAAAEVVRRFEGDPSRTARSAAAIARRYRGDSRDP